MTRFNPRNLTTDEQECYEHYARRLARYDDHADALSYALDQLPTGAVRPEFVDWLNS